MSRHRRLGALVVLLLTATLATIGWGHASAADKSFTIDAWETDATLLPSGDMQVVERLTYTFRGGPFNFGIRQFDDDAYADIEGFAVTQDGAPLIVDPPPNTPSGGYEWHLPGPTSDTTATYELSYTVRDAAEVGPDVAELYWDFTGDQHPGLGTVHIDVHLPGDSPNATPDTPDDDASVVRAWGHGPSNGVVSLGQSLVTAQVDDVPSGEFVELRILVPTADMTATPTGDPRLSNVLKEEGAFIGDLGDKPKEPDPWYRPLGFAGTAIAAIGGLLGLGWIWRRWGREPKSKEVLGDYWREPLEDPPAVVVATMGKGGLDRPKAIASTLMDMAQRGYISISADERGKEHTFHWMGKPYGPDVQPFERQLLDLVFRGQTVMAEEDLTRWARHNRSSAASEMSSWASAIERDYKARQYSTGAKGKPMAMLILVGVVMAALGGLSFLLSGGIGWVAIVLAVVVIAIGAFALGNRTQSGAEAYAKAKGLQKFLKDFSQLDEAPVGHLILWERYLVYSVALGVSADLVRNIAFKVPEVANDPGFAVWYVGHGAGRFDSIGRMGDVGSSISSSFSPPSSSGSGGGFSGGGGGGGGGGGTGAR